MKTEQELSRQFLTDHPGDAARILEVLPTEASASVLSELEVDVAAEVLEAMTSVKGAGCLISLEPSRAGAVIQALNLDVAAGLLRRMSEERIGGLLAATRPETSDRLRSLLRFPENSAGALMDPKVLTFPEDIAVGEALERVRENPQFALYYLYVVDRSQRIVGVLNIRELFLAPFEEVLENAMHTGVARLRANADRSEIVAHPGWREFHALPVVDHESRFIGAIRYETLRRLEEGPAEHPRGADLIDTVSSLGELYWVGVSGALHALASVAGASDKPKS